MPRAAKKTITSSAAIMSRDPYKLYISIEGDTPKATNSILGAHWRSKHSNATKWKSAIISAVKLFRPDKPLESFEVSILRHSYRQLDFDGCVASMKPIVDGLKDIVIVDDSWRRTGVWKVDQKFRPKKEGPLIEIWITERKLQGH